MSFISTNYKETVLLCIYVGFSPSSTLPTSQSYRRQKITFSKYKFWFNQRIIVLQNFSQNLKMAAEKNLIDFAEFPYTHELIFRKILLVMLKLDKFFLYPRLERLLVVMSQKGLLKKDVALDCLEIIQSYIKVNSRH